MGTYSPVKIKYRGGEEMKKNDDKKSNKKILIISACLGAVVGLIASMNNWI